MTPVSFDITYTETRDRLSSGLRLFYALPHLIITSALGYFSNALSVIQWFIILFTGKRNQALWNLSRGVVDWQSRSTAYASLMYDTYPNFGFTRLNEPVHFDVTYDEDANRLTCALRIIWAIPALVITILVGIAAFVVTIISWFAIVFTGKHPRGMFDFMLKAQRMGVRTSAYLSLLTDTYPKYE